MRVVTFFSTILALLVALVVSLPVPAPAPAELAATAPHEGTIARRAGGFAAAVLKIMSTRKKERTPFVPKFRTKTPPPPPKSPPLSPMSSPRRPVVPPANQNGVGRFVWTKDDALKAKPNNPNPQRTANEMNSIQFWLTDRKLPLGNG